MYVILLIALAFVIVIGSFWSPIFALIIAVPLFIAFLAYVGLSRRADEKLPAPAGAPEPGEKGPEHGGIWGEREA